MFAFNPVRVSGQGGARISDQTERTNRLPICAVRLIDRRTGAAHRINGTPLVVFTRHPDDAAAELLEVRDATVWQVRIDLVDRGNRP